MGYEMMGSAGAIGGGHMFFGGLMMIIWLAVVIAVIVMLVRWFSGEGFNLPAFRGGKRALATSALALLEDRYAKGEIESKEFDERAQKLRQTGNS